MDDPPPEFRCAGGDGLAKVADITPCASRGICDGSFEYSVGLYGQLSPNHTDRGDATGDEFHQVERLHLRDHCEMFQCFNTADIFNSAEWAF
ncbi:MAG: hypothetical protein Q4F71_02970, partial [Paracoccus sp. (in: a-proteobacteria)]|nr:hypothetical protein [Paracoccus sp. (in: a-proteobacteria)]